MTLTCEWCFFAVRLQDADFDSQSQSSYDRALSERGHSQMSSDDTWKGKSNASKYAAFTQTHTFIPPAHSNSTWKQFEKQKWLHGGEKKFFLNVISCICRCKIGLQLLLFVPLMLISLHLFGFSVLQEFQTRSCLQGCWLNALYSLN